MAEPLLRPLQGGDIPCIPKEGHHQKVEYKKKLPGYFVM
jgi:hypothetical protein